MATVAPNSLKRLSQSTCNSLSCLIDAVVGGRGLLGEPLSWCGGGGGVSAITTDPVDGRALALSLPFADLLEAGTEPDGASFEAATSTATGAAAASAFALPALLVFAFRPAAADFVFADAAPVPVASSATSGKAAVSARGVFRGAAEGAEIMPEPVEDRRRELPAGRTHLWLFTHSSACVSAAALEECCHSPSVEMRKQRFRIDLLVRQYFRHRLGRRLRLSSRL